MRHAGRTSAHTRDAHRTRVCETGPPNTHRLSRRVVPQGARESSFSRRIGGFSPRLAEPADAEHHAGRGAKCAREKMFFVIAQRAAKLRSPFAIQLNRITVTRSSDGESVTGIDENDAPGQPLASRSPSHDEREREEAHDGTFQIRVRTRYGAITSGICRRNCRFDSMRSRIVRAAG